MRSSTRSAALFRHSVTGGPVWWCRASINLARCSPLLRAIQQYPDLRQARVQDQQVGFPVIVEVSRVLVIVRTSDGERLRGECAIAVVDGDTNSIGTRTIAADYAQPSVAENVDSGKRQGAGGNRDGSWPGECSGA